MKFKRSSGVLAHPTSFPNAFGIGDLGSSAYRFIDFLHKSGQKLWQILPLGPTSFGDSPYQSFSSYAGNPFLISPELLLKEGYLTEENLAEYKCKNFEKIQYDQVFKDKNLLLYTAYQSFLQNGSKKQKLAFSAFCLKNKNWLVDYTLFIALKNHFIHERKFMSLSSLEYSEYANKCKNLLQEDNRKNCFYGSTWNSWSEDLVKRKPETLALWINKLADEISFHQFVQYEFFRQWQLLKKYANKKNISVIGDIPIFTSLDSADCWANQSLFQLDKQGYPISVAGVPPDYFSLTGQLWGNPLYNWDAHEKQQYQWWIGRLSHILNMVDIIRIDHFRGFESYWSVPFGEETAENGSWVKGPGMKFFHAVKKSLGEIPIIAEDLGIITEAVEQLRSNLGFPGMKVLQFGFDLSKGNTHLPHNYTDGNCVVYSGTHDNDTTVGWYTTHSEEGKDFFRRYLNVSGEDPAWDLIRLCLSSSGIFAIVPIQDLMSLPTEFRMNTPGVASGNWQFRYQDNFLSDHIAERLLYITKLYDRE